MSTVISGRCSIPDCDSPVASPLLFPATKGTTKCTRHFLEESQGGES